MGDGVAYRTWAELDGMGQARLNCISVGIFLQTDKCSKLREIWHSKQERVSADVNDENNDSLANEIVSNPSSILTSSMICST
jgi:hypothetical protein